MTSSGPVFLAARHKRKPPSSTASSVTISSRASSSERPAAVKAGLPVRKLKAEGDKVARARTIAARYEAGTVFHRRGAAWCDAWENELADFPTGRHDDQVDTAAYAGIQLVTGVAHVGIA